MVLPMYPKQLRRTSPARLMTDETERRVIGARLPIEDLTDCFARIVPWIWFDRMVRKAAYANQEKLLGVTRNDW